ncbi:UNVERIFIED_CONTAM: hypothetical protein K2H54_030990 [Gekko kuhli]
MVREAKTLAADPEKAPVNGSEESVSVEEEAGHSETAEEQLMLEDVSEDESHPSEPEITYEAAEEMGKEEMDMTEQEEDPTNQEADEQNELGEPGDLLDETLLALYSPLEEVIEQLTFNEMVNILQELTRLQLDSVKQSFTRIFQNKFAVFLSCTCC